jgi:hypothetical protein
MTEPMKTTMTTIKRTRDNSTVERSEGTANPKDRKAPCSILKGKNQDANEEEKQKNDKKTKLDDDIITPPNLRRGKGNEDIRSNLGFTFENMNNKEESIAKNKKK